MIRVLINAYSLGQPSAGGLGGLLARRRLQYIESDGHAQNLGWAIVNARAACIAVIALQRQIGGVTQRAVDLDGAIDNAVESLGDEHLGHGDLLTVGLGMLKQ